MANFHDEIIRIKCNYPKDSNFNQRFAYQSGHRDARHAAAEIANEADGIISELLEALEEILELPRGPSGRIIIERHDEAKINNLIAKAKGE